MCCSDKIQKRLISLSDESFRDFNARLMPTVDKNTVIGVKTPLIKAMAKEIFKSREYKEFLSELPHKYFEENQLHAFIVSQIKDFDDALFELERFLPYIDNWATCDQLVMNAFSKSPERILPSIDKWLKSSRTYTIRFAIGQLMRYFLDERFSLEYSDRVAAVISGEYYVNMMSAWYFTTALAKQYDAALPYFKEGRLSAWVHNKAIQKARESYRVTDARKEELLKLKITRRTKIL